MQSKGYLETSDHQPASDHELVGKENHFQEADDNLRLLREGNALDLQLYKSAVQKEHKLEKKVWASAPHQPLTLARMGAH